MEIARHKMASAAKRCGIALKQAFVKQGKELRRKAGGYAHAKQFKRLRRTVKRQRTILGVRMREAQRGLQAISRGIAQHEPTALDVADLMTWLERAERIRTQQRHSKNKLYADATTPTLSGIDLTERKSTASVSIALCQAPDGTTPTSKPGTPSAVTPDRDLYGPASSGLAAQQPPALPSPDAGNCYIYGKSEGRRVYLLDLDGDGYLDIVTTLDPGYSFNSGRYGVIPSGSNPLPTAQQICQGTSILPSGPMVCSRVWMGSASGAFQEKTAPNDPTNIVNSSLYSDPVDPMDRQNPYWRLPGLADINGDGLLDVLASGTGRWVSAGNGNFISSTVTDSSQVCGTPIDFNGDGRADCLWPGTSTGAGSQWLTLSYGANSSGALARFDIQVPLYGVVQETAPQDLRQKIGVVIDDFDGDGRQDILRWGQTPATDNRIFYSNGDGSFRDGGGAGLESTGLPLQHIDGSATFVVGDFLGSGAVQILHIKRNPSASNPNKLYARPAQPPDLLQTLTSPSGLVSTVGTRVPVSNAPGTYVSERGTAQAASSPMIDVTMPMYVVPSIQEDTGTGSPLITDYLYKGFKAFRDGSGSPGFREVRQRRPAPGGSFITTATEVLLKRPFGGVANRISTYLGGLNLSGSLLSQVSNVYCDRTSVTPPAAAGADTPCASTALVTRPYLYRSDKQAWELPVSNGTPLALPRVVTTSTYNDWGDPTQIVVTTTGVVAGAGRTHTRTVNNTYCDPNAAWISGGACPQALPNDQWVLGRLLSSSVTNTVPDLVAAGALTAGAGSAPLATAVQGTLTSGGTGTGTASVSPASLTFSSTSVGSTSAAQTVTVSNTGSGALAVQSVSATGDFAVAGNGCPASLAAAASCTITITFTPTVAGARSGTLTIANNGSTGNKTVALGGTGQAAGAGTASVSPSSLSFAATNVGSTSASQTVTVTNSGTAALAIQSVSVNGDFTLAGNNCPASLATGANCTITITFTPAAAGARSGMLNIANNGSSGSQTVTLSGTGQAAPPAASISPASLNFGSVYVGQSRQDQVLQVANTGSVALALSSITISNPVFSVHANGCGASLAAGSSCWLTLRFAPAATGAATATLTMTAGSLALGANLSGTGLDPAGAVAQLTPSVVSFGTVLNGGLGFRTVTLKNAGSGLLQLLSPSFAIVNNTDFAFSVESNGCTAALAAGASCNINVAFSPIQAARSYSATLQVSTTAGVVTAQLQGTSGNNPPVDIPVDQPARGLLPPGIPLQQGR